ncbi:MAG: flavodoxin-dependent (E)-4-hydroxy-3-methylbut-2-enyl-diphosphate synthase [Oscillospiraceae bacterium]|nr:flavodoxin-dependent (E)-4-hydroxy-3-methylbut-2-enyl-diphosphate synthase [Oscillospiraceae bacterium]
MKRRAIKVGHTIIGGGMPVSIQSMCDTNPHDATETLAQMRKLHAVGCEIVRVAVPDTGAIKPLAEVMKAAPMPVVADIHFDYKLAIEAVAAGVNAVRINPGNISEPERVRAVAFACQTKGVPIRIGVNGGSLDKSILAKHGAVTAQALVDSAHAQMEMLRRYDFEDICVSLKCSSVPTTIEAYRLMYAQSDVPLHVGVTEAGTLYHGLVKSSAALGALLVDGIGDTIRVSLCEDVVEEIKAAKAILQAMGLREGVEVIACPTCGRTKIDLKPLVREVERRLEACQTAVKIAVMGCVVNGPGEARDADYGIAGGIDEGLLFRKGEVVAKMPQRELVDGLMALIAGDEANKK